MYEQVRITPDVLRTIFDILSHRYRIIGPKTVNGTVVMSDIIFDDIPAGFRESQGPGTYRLKQANAQEMFSFSPGPDSFKKFLHPSSTAVFSFRKAAKGLTTEAPAREDRPLAFIGTRACDLAALALLDKVFMEGPVVDYDYESRRKDIFIVSVNCLHPSENCFCDSMGSGPDAREGFDLALTEIDGSFVVEAGSVEGERVLAQVPHKKLGENSADEKKAAISRCREMMKKSMKTGDLPGVLYRNMDHPRWAEIAERDLECGNCTTVCPTCFCTSTFDLLSLKTVAVNRRELTGTRKRTWDSCFSKNFARVHSGNFRPSRRARYRQWMTHKLAYWIDQFGRPGCVGCGRCITWCPVGIDITREIEELRRVR